MIRVDKQTQAQLDAVRKKCQELDAEHEGIELEKKLDEALEYAARFGDHDLEGKSINILRPLDSYWSEGKELTIEHFNFGINATRPTTGESWYFVAMHYHNGGRGLPWASVEVSPQEGPHWSFHS